MDRVTLSQALAALTSKPEPCPACKGSRRHRPGVLEDALLGCCGACEGTGRAHGAVLARLTREPEASLRWLAAEVVRVRGASAEGRA